MTGEKLYENVLTMLTAYEALGDVHINVAKEIIAHPEEWEKSTISPFHAAAARLIIEARRLMDQKTTKNSVVSAVKRILKNARRGYCKIFKGIFLYDGKFTVCDRGRLLRLNEDIAQLPHTQYQPTGPDLKKIIDATKKDGETLCLPTVGELKAYIIEQKQTYGKLDIPYYCLDDHIWVNPHYLLDMLNALPGCIAYKPDRLIDPIYFKAENGDGLLLPIRPPCEI